MSVVSLAVRQLVHTEFNYPKRKDGSRDYSKSPVQKSILTIDKLDKADTFVAIFGLGQQASLDFFLKQVKKGKINLLFQSKRCMNTNFGHPGFRNTIVIFELP